jgi:hypothetical protein
VRHLRDYQREAITDLLSRWDAGSTRVPMVLATGLGKTEIFTALESEWVGEVPGRDVRARQTGAGHRAHR